MSTTLQDLLVPDVSVLEKIVRPLLVYVFLVVALRLAGKRQLAQVNTFDLVVLLMLSNTVQNAIIGADNSVSGGIIGATTLLVANYLTVRFLFQHPGLDRRLEGPPVLLIDGGKVRHEAMKGQLVTVSELVAACHHQGVESLDQVDRAILETSGSISIFPRHPTPDEVAADDVQHRLFTIEELLRQIAREQPARP